MTGPIRCPAASEIRSALLAMHPRALFDQAGLEALVDEPLFAGYLGALSTFWDEVRLEAEATVAQGGDGAALDAMLVASQAAMGRVHADCIGVLDVRPDSAHGAMALSLLALLAHSWSSLDEPAIADTAHAAYEAGRLALTGALAASQGA